VSVKVDGQDAGYGKIYRGLNPSFTGVFIGWLQQSGGYQAPCYALQGTLLHLAMVICNASACVHMQLLHPSCCDDMICTVVIRYMTLSGGIAVCDVAFGQSLELVVLVCKCQATTACLC
jgi:hypothetical protein